jgi:phosphoribosylaminoimidazole-succinocarboxamide synthase
MTTTVPNAIITTHCPALKLLARGKVRDVYEACDQHLLFVATDRISAFDVVMANGIPGKGKVLTQLSLFWFELLKDLCPHHLVTANVDQMPPVVQQYRDQIEGRAMLVRKLKILPVEAIVRGYLTGSGLKEYKKSQTVCNIPLPAGLGEASKLASPLYTPSTKAEIGAHDENIHPDQAAKLIGDKAETVKTLAVQLYSAARDYAATRGIIIADTKFEFGTDASGKVILADEVLTPDSSRFWPAKEYKPGVVQNSFDKQYLRDYLESVKFDKNGKGIELPKDVVDRTLAKYVEAFRLITGKEPQL